MKKNMNNKNMEKNMNMKGYLALLLIYVSNYVITVVLITFHTNTMTRIFAIKTLLFIIFAVKRRLRSPYFCKEDNDPNVLIADCLMIVCCCSQLNAIDMMSVIVIDPSLCMNDQLRALHPCYNKMVGFCVGFIQSQMIFHT